MKRTRRLKVLSLCRATTGTALTEARAKRPARSLLRVMRRRVLDAADHRGGRAIHDGSVPLVATGATRTQSRYGGRAGMTRLKALGNTRRAACHGRVKPKLSPRALKATLHYRQT